MKLAENLLILELAQPLPEIILYIFTRISPYLKQPLCDDYRSLWAVISLSLSGNFLKQS